MPSAGTAMRVIIVRKTTIIMKRTMTGSAVGRRRGVGSRTAGPLLC
jgi:hypothetical protein